MPDARSMGVDVLGDGDDDVDDRGAFSSERPLAFVVAVAEHVDADMRAHDDLRDDVHAGG